MGCVLVVVRCVIYVVMKCGNVRMCSGSGRVWCVVLVVRCVVCGTGDGVWNMC